MRALKSDLVCFCKNVLRFYFPIFQRSFNSATQLIFLKLFNIKIAITRYHFSIASINLYTGIRGRFCFDAVFVRATCLELLSSICSLSQNVVLNLLEARLSLARFIVRFHFYSVYFYLA